MEKELSREIKFRAWNGETMNYSIITGKFGAFWVNAGRNNDGLDENNKASLTKFNTKCLETTKVMQFTGLKDKNGKEIYEGDQLFICAGYSSIVEFKDAMFVSVYSHPEDGEIIPLLDAVGKDTIVIGNIYENK
jgi:uncharacterized phage protein (TIGR01671 family)